MSIENKLMKKVAEFISDKYCSVISIMDEMISDILDLTERVKRESERIINPRKFNDMIGTILGVVPKDRIYTKGLLPAVTLERWKNYYKCKVCIVDSGVKINFDVRVGHLFEFPYSYTLDLIVRSSAVTEYYIFTYESFGGAYTKWKYTYNQPLYLLLLLYKFTTIGDEPKVKNVLEDYGVLDVITYLSEVDFKVRYPIYEEAIDIFGKSILGVELVDRLRFKAYGKVIHDELKDRLTSCILNILRRQVREQERSYELLRLWCDFGHKFSTMNIEAYLSNTFGRSNYGVIIYGPPEFTWPSELGRIIKSIDEFVFALAYYVAVMSKLASYLGV